MLLLEDKVKYVVHLILLVLVAIMVEVLQKLILKVDLKLLEVEVPLIFLLHLDY